MNAPRVSDERIEYHLDFHLNHKMTHSTKFKTSFVLDLLQDLKDARDHLKTHQEMRTLYNKEPE